MSYNLWKNFFEDDVDAFRQYLARATYTHGSSKTTATASGSPAFKIGSPGSLGSSPKTPLKSRKSTHVGSAGKTSAPLLTRADVNVKDNLGRTLLHHAASSRGEHALEFIRALLEIPLLDLYVQDAENGWTALHRALYFGNIDIAQALMSKDIQNATDFASTALHVNVGGLVKIKDVEGDSPFEVFGSSIAPRSIHDATALATLDAADNESVNSLDVRDEVGFDKRNTRLVSPLVNVSGDEVFAFGSNKNLTLGLGDEDDRHFPERIQLRRSEHLLNHLYENFVAEKSRTNGAEDIVTGMVNLPGVTDLPAVVVNKPIGIQDVVMSKMHTAVLTDDPLSNLFVAGFGPGGRLGTGDENTRFHFVCIEGGGLSKRRVVTVALGYYHTIAICSSGEVFTWGSNKYGQLGYALPDTSSKEIPMQLSPRQLYGLVKKEQIIGAAASSIHSAIFTPSALYTFGKNEGQLGVVDADARSLDIQIIPRRVGTSILQTTIKSVSAIEHATTVLLENHDVIVFTQYAWKKVVFPLEEAPNMFFSQALKTRYDHEVNAVTKVTCGGNTICALSTFGQVFTVEVPKDPETIPSNVSTTNPNKARNALPPPVRVWSIGKPHMKAVDVAVGQDGSIVLCTVSGSVWRKEKRANIKSIHAKPSEGTRTKDYKFVRVPNLSRAVAVRSNAFGAFTVVRKDCTVTRDQISEAAPTLWHDMFPLLSFHEYGVDVPNSKAEQPDEPLSRFWVPSLANPSAAAIKQKLIANDKAEDDFKHMSRQHEPLSDSSYDIWVTSNVTDVRLPVHAFILKARSRVLRRALANFIESYYFEIPDVLCVEYGADGQIQIKFYGADFLTLVNVVLYVYCEDVVDVWHHTSRNLASASRYRQVRVEVMKIAQAVELTQLERAARVMNNPSFSLRQDLEAAFADNDFFSDADVAIDLGNDAEAYAHSAFLSARCPFFEGLFHGRASGMWMSSRRRTDEEHYADMTRVDLKHVDTTIFHKVLRHIYADTGEELFDDVIASDVDKFIDVVIDVLSLANELMLDRLSQICQKVLGRYVTLRNVCGLLNTVAECSVTDFKVAALEYICLNLEAMLEQGLLGELEDYLVEELSLVVQENQLAYMPFARSGHTEAELLDRHPELAEDLEQARQRRIDSMRLQTRLNGKDVEDRPVPRRRSSHHDEDLPFRMDDDGGVPQSPHMRSERPSPSITPLERQEKKSSQLALGTSLSCDEDFTSTSLDTHRSSVTAALPMALSSPLVSAVREFELPKAAWSSATATSSETKMDFKSIMEQTSSSRVSNLTQAMVQAAGSTPKGSSKLSQRERKKQQLESRKQEALVSPVQTSSDPRPSPWNPVKTASPTSIGSPSPRTVPSTRPGMTMRQTVARSPATSKSAMSPSEPARVNSSPAQPAAQKPGPPTIQSIRHTPTATRSASYVDARTSMADILSQQAGEKIAIKEAAAKRSLQEIQQEQEFQEWWDQETRRVQEEEEEARANATRSRKPSRGRGGRKRGSGRDDPTTPQDEKPVLSGPSKVIASMAATTSTDRGQHRSRGKARGNGGGRGRGGPIRVETATRKTST